MSHAPAYDPAAVDVAVVSLDRATDRRALMRAECEKAGIAARFHAAVDARTDEGAAQVAALPDHGPWGAFQAHGKACTLSHLALLREFLAGDAAYCLVLEDDAFLSPDLGAWLGDMNWWPGDADLVKIERWRDDKMLVVLGKPAATHLGRRIARLFSRHSGTAGYIVNRRGAAKIVAQTRPDMPIDHLLFNVGISALARRLVTYQVTPALSVQGNEPAPMAAAAPHPAPVEIAENVTFRELRRGWHEIRGLPRLLALVATGRARAEKIEWRAHAA